MSAVAVGSVCASCGNAFEQRERGSGRPRLHCEVCRKPRLAKAPVRKRRPVGGEPFTVEHFSAWAGRLRLDSGELWRLDAYQELFVADVFAGIPECWLIVPEGNGKTTLIAGLALYHIEFRQDAMVPVAAAARDQAGIIYRQASGFVRRNRLTQFRCLPGMRRIECPATDGRIQIFAADASVNDGVIFTWAIIDELHRHKTLELQRTWSGKLDKRPDAQLIVISTAGEPGGEFEEERQAIRQSAPNVEREETFVRALSETTVLHEWAVPEDGDVEDLELVARANPASWITAEQLRLKQQRIRHLGHWKRFTCNVPTRGDSAAIAESDWFAAVTEERIPEGEPVWLGLDLGWVYDTTAMVPLWLREPGFRLLGAATILEPPMDGSQLDAHEVERALFAIHDRNPVHTVVMDMTNGEQLAQWIQEELGAEVVARSQGPAMQALDYARFMEALRMGWLRHTGDPGLTSHALNAVARMLPNGQAVFERPHKARKVSAVLQRRRVVDALDAAAMVHTTAAAELSAEPAGSWLPL